MRTDKHRYYLGGGSYDRYWLFSPDGTQVDAAGETEAQVAEFRAVCGK